MLSAKRRPRSEVLPPPPTRRWAFELFGTGSLLSVIVIDEGADHAEYHYRVRSRQPGTHERGDRGRSDVDLTRHSAASPIVLQALLAGEIDVAATSVATLVSSRLAGADTVMILGMVRTFVDHIITEQNITRPEQLKGKIGGVNRIGSTSDLGLRFALRRLGIDPDKDAKVITAGGNPERFAALSKGVINFTIIPEPFVRQALQLGFRDLFDIGSLKIPFGTASCRAKRS